MKKELIILPLIINFNVLASMPNYESETNNQITDPIYHIISLLSDDGYYPEDSVRTIEISDHLLIRRLEKHIRIDNISDISQIKIKSEKAIRENKEVYYPDFIIEKWTFNSEKEARNLWESVNDLKYVPFLNKPPQALIVKDKYIIYIKTRAEIFREEMNRLVLMIERMDL